MKIDLKIKAIAALLTLTMPLDAAFAQNRTSTSRPAGATSPEAAKAAQLHGGTALPDEKDIPNIPSQLKSLDEALSGGATHSYVGKDGKVVMAKNPVEVFENYVEEFIATKDFKNEDKVINVKWYELGDPRAEAAVLKAQAKGIQINIITDINNSMKGNFKEGESESTDYESATFSDSPSGKVARDLITKHGFTFTQKAGHSLFLTGVPLFKKNADTEVDLMHDKSVSAGSKSGKSWSKTMQTTANLNAGEAEAGTAKLPSFGGRYNQVYIIDDEAISQLAFDQTNSEVQAYTQRLVAGRLKSEDKLPTIKRVTYPTGESAEPAWTDGEMNLNQRIESILTRALDPQSGLKIKEIVKSEFVMTETNELELIRKVLTADSSAKLFGIFDQQFIGLEGPGEAAAMAGFLVNREMGKAIFPFKHALQPQLELYGYLRLLGGDQKIDSEGAPTGVHLWHDKTTLIKVVENGSEWTYVFTGSFNDSNHFQSRESQFMYKFRGDSKFAAQLEEGIKGVVQQETSFAIPLRKAIVAIVIARLTDHIPQEIDIAGQVEPFIRAIEGLNYDQAAQILQTIAQSKTRRKTPVNAKVVSARLSQLTSFLDWYGHQQNLRRPRLEDVANIGSALLSDLEGKEGHRLLPALNILFYDGKKSDQEIEALQKSAWVNGFKIRAPFPEFAPKPPVTDGKVEPRENNHSAKPVGKLSCVGLIGA